jgi:hypothetical protein
MKMTRMITLASLVFLGAVTLQSCSDEEDVKQEFVADDNTFKSFMSWPLEATNQGPDPALGTAHAGNDSTVTRKVYVQNGQDIKDGSYPVGTLIVKHSQNPGSTVNEFTAMAKRGNDFNTTGGDWEWFMLNSDGTIALDGNGNQMRGADLMGGMCVMCHTQAIQKDYVFSR